MGSDNGNPLTNPHFLRFVSRLHPEIDMTESINVLRENNQVPEVNNIGTSQISVSSVPTESVVTATDPHEPGFGSKGFNFVQTGSFPIPEGTLPAFGTGVQTQPCVVVSQSNTSHGQHITTSPLISDMIGSSGFMGFHNMTDGFSKLVSDAASEVNVVSPLAQHAAISTWPGSNAGQFPRSSPARPQVNMPQNSMGMSNGALLDHGLTGAGTYANREPNINSPSNLTGSRFPVANNGTEQVSGFPSRPPTPMWTSPRDLTDVCNVRSLIRNPLRRESSMVSPHRGVAQAAVSGQFRATDLFDSSRYIPRPRITLGPGVPLTSRILSSWNRNPSRPPVDAVNLRHPGYLRVEQGESHAQTSDDAPIPYLRWLGFVDRSEPVQVACFMCERNLSYNSSAPMDWLPNPPVAAVLPCGHAFHAECLDWITPVEDLADPPCIPCALK